MEFMYSVKNMSEEENMAVSCYLYRLCLYAEKRDGIENLREMQSLYNELVSALGLKKHSEKVVRAFIKKHVREKLLTPDYKYNEEVSDANKKALNSSADLSDGEKICETSFSAEQAEDETEHLRENIHRNFRGNHRGHAEKKRRRSSSRACRTYEEDFSPYDFSGPMKDWFMEDVRIARESSSWRNDSPEFIDQCRAVFAGGRDVFSKIVACTFFCSPDSKKDFSIPAEISVPERVISLTDNADRVRFMTDAFKLTENEGRLVNTAFISHSVRELFMVFSELFDHHPGDGNRIELYAASSGLDEKTIRSLLRKNGKLFSYNILDMDGYIDRDASEAIYSGDLNVLFMDIIKNDENSETFDLDSFSVKKEESDLIMRLLKNERGANILLYGAPGSGKTEYARALAKEAGFKPVIFKNEAELSASRNPDLYALRRLNCLLAVNKKDSVIIVDEAENILQTVMNSFKMMFGGNEISLKKGTVNSMLENGNNRVIWIMNHTRGMDESTLRRFAYSVRFNDMTPAMLRRIAEDRMAGLPMSRELVSAVAELFEQYRVTGASVDNMVRILEGMNSAEMEDDQVVRDVKSVLDSNSSLLHGKKTVRDRVHTNYDLSAVNSSVPAEDIVKMVRNARDFAAKNGSEDSGIRILFYGASGTGKTELARHIAENLHMEICFKRVSDIMSMWVGGTEKNIAAAFAEASAKGEVLLFDEADSFFADRNSAGHSWERTLVNEFLTQMEEFKGILICTTNLRKIMDPAMQRRFHILAEFRPMKTEGIEKLLKGFFPAYSFDPEQISRIAGYGTATPGDFGTLSGKIRFMDPEKITAGSIVDELCSIQKEKDSGCSRKLGFCE